MLRSSRRNQQLLLACLAGLTLFLVFTRWNRSDSVVLVEESSERKEKEEDGVQMVCRLPKLEKDRPEVMKFYTDRKHSLNCASEKDWVFVDDEGRLQLTGEAIQAHGKDTPCSVSYILRVSDFDEKTEESPEKSMIGKKLVESDFFWANCKAASGKKWSGMLMTVVRNESRVEALKARQRPSDWSDLNVYFFGLDSLSQMAYRRSLPKTVEFFERKMGGVVLDGYNIVGDGTPQAFIPILTAKTELELPPTRKTHKSPTFVDVYPFIWNNFSDAGYVTVYGEDAAAMGIYSHRMKGFDKQPTDHYVRTFFQEAEKKASNLNCIGSNSMHNVWMKYGNEVIQRYKDIPRFELFHHGRLSHDDINLVSVMDDDFAANLEHLHSTGAFESTLVILMADHGHRFASLRNTHQGQLEERLPFFGLYLPERFRASGKGKKAFENLQTNARRLSTPFDIHATLWDVLHWPSEAQLVEAQPLDRRSQSLFRPISPERTCAGAGIEPHWCTCMDWESAFEDKTQKEISLRIAQAIVAEMNNQTEPERKLCAKLELAQLFDSKRLVPPKQMMAYKNAKDVDGINPDLSGDTNISSARYQVKFKTKPGGAIYEATVLYDLATEKTHVDFKSISHVNQYGDKPHCIINKNYFLGAYCICYDKI